MTSAELRRLYLDYFRREGHQVLPSASLVPDDPTLLFTSAGMVQFKDILWGRVAPVHPCVTTCQKCFRTTDIERVGATAHHHTFFEMLGNFSFGDYFKEGAIELAWKFLARELSLPKERLWVSVYEEDEEAYVIWRDSIGIPVERIVRLGREHNWWGPVGDRGPCGPDSEIFWDWGEEHTCGPDCKELACDCERFSEIWNLVFMQYDAQPDGKLTELSRKNIDTGMGLERMSAVLQGVHSNFDTDLFRPIAEEIGALSPAKMPPDALPIQRSVVADHIRATVFLIADGVLPDSKESRGSVLRKVFIRMFTMADFLGIPHGKLPKLVEPVIATLRDVYPEIVDRRGLIERAILAEEETYRRRLETLRRRGEELPEELVVIPGELAFRWYDTDGIPRELITVYAGEKGLLVDWEGFEREMERQRARSRKVTAYDERTAPEEAAVVRKTDFVGHEHIETEDHLALILDESDKPEGEATPGEWRFVFSAKTPFYAEAGGQIADTGWIENLSQPGRAEVMDVQKATQGTVHAVRVIEGGFHQGDRCHLLVDEARRRAIARAHTATHLLHAALRRVLGEHVIQAGSSVGPEELRFDFTHFAALTPAELARVEELAFAPVLQDLPVQVEEVPLAAAKARGAIAHFAEEYRGKDRVRVVAVPGTSAELCGGTHVRRTGEIGLIVVLAEEAVAAGTRRLRAVVGETARRYLTTLREERRQLSTLAGVPEAEIVAGLGKTLDEAQALRRRVAAIEAELAVVRSQDLLARARDVSGTKLLSTILDGGAEEAKRLADALAARLGRCVLVVGVRHEGRGLIVAKVVDEPRVEAGDLVRVAAEALGGKGGGRSTFAQGGGPNVQALPQAIERALGLAEDKLRGA